LINLNLGEKYIVTNEESKIGMAWACH